ncbi:hypothetical protein BpHYR1_021565 [Brachionus plicatilis]|uniref:Uncharacterized protein n=1 Tax=Brachionus plicatilis TaxID=10195 RepID=A0A3M7S6F5_BRAPC|nr:hypothetical protein BpHYR1_021565 [Brachionus plicatilis]
MSQTQDFLQAPFTSGSIDKKQYIKKSLTTIIQLKLENINSELINHELVCPKSGDICGKISHHETRDGYIRERKKTYNQEKLIKSIEKKILDLHTFLCP